jgi:hypothetical protein
VPVKVDLPGLDRVMPEVADGELLVVEGGIDPAKSFFVHYLARAAAADGRGVKFVTSRDVPYVERGLRLPHTSASRRPQPGRTYTRPTSKRR